MIKRYICIICDNCGANGYYRWVEKAKDNGWVVRFINFKTRHFCSQKCCTEFESKEE